MRELIKIDKNGSKHWRVTETCDRCQGRGWYATGTHNGELVPARPDDGVCYKCAGTGVMTYTDIERTPEYEAILQAKRRARAEKAREQAAREEAEQAIRDAEIRAEIERVEREQAAREAEEAAAKARSQYVGREGEKITFEGVVDFVASYEVRDPFGRPESRRCYKFRDPDGNAIVWNTGAWKPIEAGDRVQVTGTVKRHSEYKGEKQTSLIRCKIEQR